jgi:hypothetical protein
MFEKAKHRLITQEPNGFLTEHFVVVIKRDLHNLKEVALMMEKYGKDRGFYFPLDQLPFPMARSNEELCAILTDFDEAAQRQRWDAFAAENGFCEDGHAAERCAQWILERMKG